jgi:hypothetical protein
LALATCGALRTWRAARAISFAVIEEAARILGVDVSGLVEKAY